MKAGVLLHGETRLLPVGVSEPHRRLTNAALRE